MPNPTRITQPIAITPLGAAQQLREALRLHTDRLTSAHTRCESVRKHLESDQSRVEQFDTAIETLRSHNNTFAAEVLADARDRITSVVADRKRDIATHEENIARYQREIASINLKLAALAAKPAMCTSEQELVNALSKNPKIPPEMVGIFIDDGRHYLRWGYSGVLMSPNRNPHTSIFPQPARDIKIRLPRIVAVLCLEDGTLSLSPVLGQREENPFYWSSSFRVHPHILGADVPCLGDFGAPIMEALSAGDISLVTELVQLYLEHANDADSAGKNWYRALNPTPHPPDIRATTRDGETICGKLRITTSPEGAIHRHIAYNNTTLCINDSNEVIA